MTEQFPNVGVLAARRDDELTILAERQGSDGVGMWHRLGSRIAGGGVPGAVRIVFAGGHNELAVRSEQRGGYRPAVFQRRSDRIARLYLVHLGGVVLAGGEEKLAVGAEGNDTDGVRLADGFLRLRGVAVPAA